MIKKYKANFLIKNTLILISSSLIIKALSLLNRIVITRLLGQDGISLYVLTLPTIMLLCSISGFSLNITLSKITAENEKIGISENHPEYLYEYADFIIELFKNIKVPENFSVAIDTANGATYKVAEYIFKTLGIKHKILSNMPDGININKDCGSTHLENLKKFVVENKMSLGIAYDGDGDRCLAVDELGNVIDGDIILAIVSKYLKKYNKLNKNTIVATIMSNLGLKIYSKDNNIKFIDTKVGDRYVLEEMLKKRL